MKDTNHISVGKTGEDIACRFLKKKGFRILERNVNRKWGELDIVAEHKKTKCMHIVEVKTVSGSAASTQTHPAENLTKAKLEKLVRTSILYAKENDVEDWQLDAVLVWYNRINQNAEIQFWENIAK